MNLYSKLFIAILVTLPTLSMATLSDAIITNSGRHLGKPYLSAALGDGPQGYFDQYPLYRTDAFDCETLVDVVLAESLAKNLTDIEPWIKKIRYKNGKVGYITRNHFISADWNPHNRTLGIIHDITPQIKDKQQKPIYKIARAEIDKAHWYEKFTIERLRLPLLDNKEKTKRLALLKEKTRHFPKEIATITYLPLTILFDANDKPNQDLFKQIPQAAIIEIIRPNWNLTKEIGSHLNVSHLGFAIWKGGILYFREASTIEHKVIDIPLTDYLATYLHSPTIKGIHIEQPI